MAAVCRFALPKNKELFFSHATRSRIVDYILRRKRYSDSPADTFAFGESLRHGAQPGRRVR